MKVAYIRCKSDLEDEFEFVQLHAFKRDHMPGAQNLSILNVERGEVFEAVQSAIKNASVAVLCITGNAPALLGLRYFRHASGEGQKSESLHESVRNQIAAYMKAHDEWLEALNNMISLPILVIPPPPPIRDNSWIREHPGAFRAALERSGISAPGYRQKLYELWLENTREAAMQAGLRFVELPKTVFDESGFLAEPYLSDEPSHANSAYGEHLLSHLALIAKNLLGPNTEGSAITPPQKGQENNLAYRDHPYRGLPDWAFWRLGVAQIPMEAFDPVVRVPFLISRTDKVATAGSCFAQHISKRLKAGGFRFMTVERTSVLDPGREARESYDFSARYGNVYTARQLLQLFDRAYGHFRPAEDQWMLPGGRFCDPFRPRIESGGYASLEALNEDRQRHLAAVREMFEQLDVFVFTLGLTECWTSSIDGAAYPLAPGVSGGEFDQSRHRFVNFSVNEVVSDLEAFFGKLREVNPTARLLLTVSPVPLAATYAAHHVLVSTTYSKSVLRVAAEMIAQAHDGVCYFPSYEIIKGNYKRGRYFDSDLRSVTKEGVDHVMAVFMRHLTEQGPRITASVEDEYDAETREMMDMAEAACDEELLERE